MEAENMSKRLSLKEMRRRNAAYQRARLADPEKRAAHNAYKRARLADPEYRAAVNARKRACQRARMADPEKRAADNARKLELARAKGIRPKKTLTGPRHPRFAGGRFCFCQVCAKALGWRPPSKISPSGTFCLKHRRVVRMRGWKKGK